MQPLRIFGFTDDDGRMALLKDGHALAAQGISLVSNGMLHALVGQEPISWPWEEQGRTNLQRLITYHRVLGLAATHMAKIIPASSESVFDDKNAVDHVLVQHQRAIVDLMARYGTQRQFSLLIRWDTATMQQLMQRFPTAKKASLEQERRNLRDQILLHLQGKLQDIIIIENSDGNVVLQAILLINTADEARIVSTLQKLDKECQGRLDMRLTGPLPACNFARVDVKLPDATFVKQACRELGLGDRTRIIDIKNAYRQRAKYLHPDQANGKHDVMVRLTQSYKYLTKLAAQQHDNENLPMVNAEQQWLRFDRKTLRRTPLMNIQRGITRWDDALLKRV